MELTKERLEEMAAVDIRTVDISTLTSYAVAFGFRYAIYHGVAIMLRFHIVISGKTQIHGGKEFRLFFHVITPDFFVRGEAGGFSFP